ncbi:MAG TPA: hypothetical protein DDZ88_27390 [Verrucomicrobiales bacterium]|nr:hypothetical protein [Verrucomicrobiales bacterium]
MKCTFAGLGLGSVMVLTGCLGGRENVLPPARFQLPANAPSVQRDLFKPGDSLELFVEEDPSFNGTFPVREGGYILIPRMGRVQVSGLDRDEAEIHLTKTLQKNQLTKARVLVEHVKIAGRGALTSPDVPKIMVYFTGSVAKPGMHMLPLIKGRPMGLYEALLITGGASRFGHLGRVEVLRPDSSGRRTRTLVDLRPIREGNADDPPLSEGDIVNVSEKVFGF